MYKGKAMMNLVMNLAQMWWTSNRLASTLAPMLLSAHQSDMRSTPDQSYPLQKIQSR